MNQITLYLMTLKGFKVLESLINTNNTSLINFVVYGQDKSVQNDYSNEIISLCQSNEIRCYNRKEKTGLPVSEYSIAISWRWMIDTQSKCTLIVLHDSLLPKYRGFAPLVSCLIKGESKIGVTALLASEEYDKGAIIDQESIPVEYPIKIEKAIKEITTCYSKLVLNIFEVIKNQKKLASKTQNEDEATYSLWRDEEDYKIDWSIDADQIKRFVDAVGYPYKGAFTTIEGRKIRILDVTVIQDVKIENRTPGKLIFYKKDNPIFVCGIGLIQINKAIYDDSKEDVLSLKKFRVRLL